MRLHVFFLTLLTAFPADARLLGEYVDGKESLPPYECLLKTFSNGKTWTCTLTMLSPTRAVGANHCIQNSILEALPGQGAKGIEHTVTCDGEHRSFLVDASNLDAEAFPLDLDHLKAGPLGSVRDVAVFTVKPPVKLRRYPRLPKDSAEVKALLANAGECRVYGYGQDETGEMDRYHGIKLEPLRTRDGTPVVAEGRLHLKPPSLNLGDSGGGVVCKSGADDVLVAVNTLGLNPAGRKFEPKTDPSAADLLAEGTLRWIQALVEPPRSAGGVPHAPPERKRHEARGQ